MIRKLILSIAIAFLPAFVIAQQGRTYPVQGVRQGVPEQSVLSVYSENGELFYVLLNGIRQNINPQSILRIEGIPQPVNDLQVIFTNNATREIQKRITFTNPIDNWPVNLTLKIARERDGDAKLRFYSMIPKEMNYQPAQGEYVMFYGQDVDRTVRNDRDRDHDRDRDRDLDRQVVVVTTPAPAPPPVSVGPTAMDPGTFASVKQTISGNSFDDTKLSTAKMIANTNYFTTDQVIELCQLFSFEDSKLAFAKYAYKKTIDNNNYFRVSDVFSFDASKQALNNYISQNH